MTETFFYIKRGDLPSLRFLADEDSTRVLIDPPPLFISTPPRTLITVKPPYKDVPFIQEKLQVLKNLIALDKSTIAYLEAQWPNDELLPKLKEQLERNLKLWADVTGGQPCQ